MRRGYSWLLASALAVGCALAASAELGFSRSITPGLIVRYMARFGEGVPPRLAGWRTFTGTAARSGATERALLDVVNKFFNRIPTGVDQDMWGAEDYWATPAETLSINGADCEDYAIAKYFTLKELGVPISRLRLVYAKTWWSRDAHLVLAYYPDPRAEPLILDNLQGAIEKASDRPDLIPVFTFNDEDLLMPQKSGPPLKVSPSSNRRWGEVLEKLERELRY